MVKNTQTTCPQFADELFWVRLTILWGWRLKGYFFTLIAQSDKKGTKKFSINFSNVTCMTFSQKKNCSKSRKIDQKCRVFQLSHAQWNGIRLKIATVELILCRMTYFWTILFQKYGPSLISKTWDELEVWLNIFH